MSKHPVVLIADDDDIYLAITESMIKMFGLQVMKAHDGFEAITIFQKHADDIGCVIMDIEMPRMDGIVAFRHLRKIRESIPVIIVTGYLDDTNTKQLALLHPAGFLKKPVSFQEISELLTKCLHLTDHLRVL